MSEKQFNHEHLTKSESICADDDLIEQKKEQNETNNANNYPSASSTHLWEITHEQSASLQALHQSMQNAAAMNSNLGTLSLSAQQQQAHMQQPQMQSQSSPQLAYQQQQQQQQQVQQAQQQQTAQSTQQQQQQQTQGQEQSQPQPQAQPQQVETPELGQKRDRGEESEDSKPAVGSDEWHQQRRENHKQVERRRRETINSGINEIARIVPGCEKNKSSILHRAAAYIRQLKDNEASTIEKWTLEKLLTDQAINELNRQVEMLKVELERVRQENGYLKRKFEESSVENSKRQRGENED